MSSSFVSAVPLTGFVCPFHVDVGDAMYGLALHRGGTGGQGGYGRNSQKKGRSWGSGGGSRVSPSKSPVPRPSAYHSSSSTAAMKAATVAVAGCSVVFSKGCDQAGLSCCRNYNVDPSRSKEVCYNPSTHVCSEMPFGRGTILCPVGQVACNTLTGQCCDAAVASLSQLQHQLQQQQQPDKSTSSAFAAFVRSMGVAPAPSTRDACQLPCTDGTACAGQNCCPHSSRLLAASRDMCYDQSAGTHMCVAPSNFADACALCPVSAPKACVFQNTGVIGCFTAQTECATILIQG